MSSKIIKNAKLKIYKGAPHMYTTLKDEVNADLFAFVGGADQRAAWQRSDP
jgi:non-heme chloroperoxidase